MFTKKIYDELADDPGLLSNKLQKKYVYGVSSKKQLEIIELLNSLIEEYSDEKFLKLGFNKDTKKLIKELITTKENNWNKIILKFCKDIKILIEREVSKSSKIKKPSNIIPLIKKELKKLHIYEEGDIINIESKDNSIKVGYISLKNSPEYNKKFKPWRDTQFEFSLYFDKGLFVWDYVNVHDTLRNKGMGTKLIILCETFAKNLGFKRFAVEWPNRLYWNRHNYESPIKKNIKNSKKMPYTHEGYKEI